jgi:AcrR family transcriptional regulator
MPSTPNESDARVRILKAASELIYEQGISASGVDALTVRANVAKATFYRHFASKDELVLEWLRSQYARWIDSVLPELQARAPSPLARLVTFWDVVGEWVEQRDFVGCPFINTLVEVRDPDHPAREEVRSFVEEVETYLARTAREAGVPTPEAFARQMRYVAMGFFTAVRLERSRAPIDTARAATIGLLAERLGTTPQDIAERVAG